MKRLMLPILVLLPLALSGQDEIYNLPKNEHRPYTVQDDWFHCASFNSAFDSFQWQVCIPYRLKRYEGIAKDNGKEMWTILMPGDISPFYVTHDISGKDDEGNEVTGMSYFAHGQHWELEVSSFKYADGHPIGVESTYNKIINGLSTMYARVYSVSKVYDECQNQGKLDVVAVDEMGNKVFEHAEIDKWSEETVRVKTHCKGGACDADEIGYMVEKSVVPPLHAALPAGKCVPKD